MPTTTDANDIHFVPVGIRYICQNCSAQPDSSQPIERAPKHPNYTRWEIEGPSNGSGLNGYSNSAPAKSFSLDPCLFRMHRAPPQWRQYPLKAAAMTEHHQQPDLLSQFPRADVQWLTDIVIHHARYVHAYLTQQAAVADQGDQNEMQFEDLDVIAAANNPPIDIPPLPPNATTMDIIRHAALCVWRKPCLRPVQELAVHKIVYEPISEGKLLVIDRTGGGKSLILQLSAVMVGGIAFVLVPLLSLTANSISKVKRTVQEYGFEAK